MFLTAEPSPHPLIYLLIYLLIFWRHMYLWLALALTISCSYSRSDAPNLPIFPLTWKKLRHSHNDHQGGREK